MWEPSPPRGAGYRVTIFPSFTTTTMPPRPSSPCHPPANRNSYRCPVPPPSPQPTFRQGPPFSSARVPYTVDTDRVPADLAVPHFSKLNFSIYDEKEDPLNWLNHCEQFFHGQCTLASVLARFLLPHGSGPNMVLYYYALEEDECHHGSDSRIFVI